MHNPDNFDNPNNPDNPYAVVESYFMPDAFYVNSSHCYTCSGIGQITLIILIPLIILV